MNGKMNAFQIEEKIEYYILKFNDKSFYKQSIDLIYQNKDALNEKELIQLIKNVFIIAKRGLSKLCYLNSIFDGFKLAIDKFKLNSYTSFYLYKNILFQMRNETEVSSFIFSSLKIEQLREKINSDISQSFIDGEKIYRQLFKDNYLSDLSFDEMIKYLSDKTIYDVILYSDDYKSNRIIDCLMNQRRVNVLLNIISASSFDITTHIDKLITFSKQMNDVELLKTIYFKVLSKGVMSYASFCEFYSLLNEKEKMDNDFLLYRYSNKMGYEEVYQLMSPFSNKKNDFSKFSFDTFIHLHLYIVKFAESEYKNSLFDSIKEELKCNKNHSDFYKILTYYPTLTKDILSLDSVIEFSLLSSSNRQKYLSLIKENSLFDSVNLKRYQYVI